MEPTGVMRDKRGQRNAREPADRHVIYTNGPRCKVDPDHLLGIAGIVGTVLNLLVVVLVYVYTPV